MSGKGAAPPNFQTRIEQDGYLTLILWMINTKYAVFFINKLMDNTSIDLCDRILQGFKCGAIDVS